MAKIEERTVAQIAKQRFRSRATLSHSKGKRNQQPATAISSRITGINRVAFQIQEKTTNN